MVGEWMMDLIKIPYYHRLGSSCTGLHSQRRFSGIGEHTGSVHDCNLAVPFDDKPIGSEGPGHNRLPTVPFGGKTAS
ncbi:hypothetical protein M5K25_004702 [Dendrobium thyrsiflorum]|uniref:Uncharacterized protein n=1 Tax=Dendrobium thyrsiflorum TaxID=117978 RepID=A0ABD0VGU3_DENTH